MFHVEHFACQRKSALAATMFHVEHSLSDLLSGVLGHRGMDRAGSPIGGLGDEAGEESSGGRADLVTALRVPLNSQNEVRLRVVRVLSAFYGLDHAILGAACDDPQTVSGDSNGLVMAGVDGKAEEIPPAPGLRRE